MKAQFLSIAAAVALAVGVSDAHAGETFATEYPVRVEANCMPRASAGVPLLQGFRVDYQSGDHHLWAISVDARSDIARDRHRLDHRDAMCVTYMDGSEGGVFVQGPPDAFSFRAEYFNETRPGVIAQSLRGSCEGGECTIALRPPSGDYVFVLIGFDMHFAGGSDHHLSTISILPSEDQRILSVRLNDKNEDDDYAFAVSYAWAPAAYVRILTTISGTNARGLANQAVEVPTGEGLIRGFVLTFGSLSSPSGSDHHTDEIGVSTHFGLDRPHVEARFNDKNDDDRFEWRIDVAAVESPPLDHGEFPEEVER